MVRGSGIAMSCGVDQKHAPDPTQLWLWRRLAAAALIPPVARELPYAVGATAKAKKKKKRERERVPFYTEIP